VKIMPLRCYNSGKKAAEEAIGQGGRLTAGLHVAAGNFCIGPDCLQNIPDKNRKEEEKKYQTAIKMKEEYDKLLAEKEAIQLLNKTPKQWSAGQLQTMVKWYKNDKLELCLARRLIYLLGMIRQTILEIRQLAPPMLLGEWSILEHLCHLMMKMIVKHHFLM
jgi:hypothetical protein